MPKIDDPETFVKGAAGWCRPLAVLCLLVALTSALIIGHAQASTADHSGYVSVATAQDDHPCDAGHALCAEHCHMGSGCSLNAAPTTGLSIFGMVPEHHWSREAVFCFGQAVDPQIRPPQPPPLA